MACLVSQDGKPRGRSATPLRGGQHGPVSPGAQPGGGGDLLHLPGLRAGPGDHRLRPRLLQRLHRRRAPRVGQLASLVENIKRLKVDTDRQPRDTAREPPDTRLCERHREKLHYFCEDDGKLLCVMCRESREHRPHTAMLVEKAAQPHRVRMLCPPREEAGPRALRKPRPARDSA